jgi:hypothetical protein
MTPAHIPSHREPGTYQTATALTNARDLMRTLRHRVMLVMGGGTIVLHALSPGALRELIRADYFTRPVPREITP